MSELQEPKDEKLDFVREIVKADLALGKNGNKVVTRFPPEPNGYLHIGHAKSICLNFGIAKEFNGRCHLRFDDTNPEKEDVEYVDSIQEDVKWLGFDWGEHRYFASDYFDKIYAFAIELIKRGKAYVCHLTAEQVREYRGTLTEPGKESPYRNRSVEENLALFEQMKNGELADGECVLRAKIDMASPNLVMRDPAIYRIRKVAHHRTGDKWCVYPMYDFTHCLSDATEGITHSICTLEFEINRPLYDWVLDNVSAPCHPQQIEFARLNLTYTVMSKRKLLELVQKKYVSGWDDPRMPTICGIRRRGYTPEAIRNFCDKIGVAKRDNLIDLSLLEHCLRDDLNEKAPRVMGVLRPLKVVIINYPEGQIEELEAANHPQNPEMGMRKIEFSREIYIEQDDFMEDAPKKFFRLSVGREVRFRYAYYITCQEVIKNDAGEVVELRCTYDPETKGGSAPDGRKVKATIHWVSASSAIEAEAHIYDRLFLKENMDAKDGKDYKDHLNPNSLEILPRCFVEASLKDASIGATYQFERKGYFCVDKDSSSEKMIFNQAVSLKEDWTAAKKSS